MARKSYSRLLQKIKDLYFRLGSVVCPALGNELVFFNRLGFRHFLRNKNGMRPIGDQMRRYKLFLNYAIEIVSSTQTKATFSNKGEHCDDIHLYSLIKEVEVGLTIKVVVRKNSKGIFHFLSIMDD
jgi:hypothetical protein